jgi:hypothetical protein
MDQEDGTEFAKFPDMNVTQSDSLAKSPEKTQFVTSNRCGTLTLPGFIRKSRELSRKMQFSTRIPYL